MAKLDQNRAPILEALQNHKTARYVHLDVPGHKQGRGNPELTAFLGKACLEADVNSMKPLDNLTHPVSVIREAEELAADAFGAAHAFFMVNGTTSAVQSMIMSVCKRGDKIILPRNVHKSVINALVLCGAVPVYVNPQTHERLGIALGMSLNDVRDAIEKNPDAKAIFVNNPTYYGICSDVAGIVELAHSKGMKVLCDEAHGTLLYFGSDLPISAMAAGADMASVSMHKSGGSLTQSSLLLMGPNMNEGYVRSIINLMQTTSGSYLLMSSLDISRKTLALKGEEITGRVLSLAQYARDEINGIGDYYAYSRELRNGDSIYDFDPAKLSVNTLDIGISGIEIYDILRDEYDIQVEFGDVSNFLAYVSVGDRERDIERLVSALSEIRRRYKRDKSSLLKIKYFNPEVEMTPQQAFYADKTVLPLEETQGHICAECVMCYPPGIPILAPGERITAEIIDFIKFMKQEGASLTGPEDLTVSYLNVII